MRNLDEEIRYCEEVAEAEERKAKLYQSPDKNVKGSGRKYNACIKRAKEYRQRAEWLRELKAYREAREEIIRKRDSSQWSELVVHGFSHAIHTIDNHLKEVNADDKTEDT